MTSRVIGHLDSPLGRTQVAGDGVQMKWGLGVDEGGEVWGPALLGMQIPGPS